MSAIELSRRGFLNASFLSGFGLHFTRLEPMTADASVAPAAGAIEYTGYEQLLAERWAWDRTARIPYCVDCYPGNCSWTAYVKDDMVIREELNEGLPDMNPLGCQEGAAFADGMYGQERERGSGKWRRASWDEALGAVADAIIEAGKGTART